MRGIVIASLVIAIARGGATADEKKIGEADVPKPVLDGVAKKYPAAKRLGYEKEVENGKTVYEVKVMNEGRKIDLDVTPDGRIVEEEQEIAWSAAPDAVKKASARRRSGVSGR